MANRHERGMRPYDQRSLTKRDRGFIEQTDARRHEIVRREERLVHEAQKAAGSMRAHGETVFRSSAEYILRPADSSLDETTQEVINRNSMNQAQYLSRDISGITGAGVENLLDAVSTSLEPPPEQKKGFLRRLTD